MNFKIWKNYTSQVPKNEIGCNDNLVPKEKTNVTSYANKINIILHIYMSNKIQ